MKIYFDFMGKKWVFLAISLVLIGAGLIGLAVRGLHFGIEFQGGTSIDLTMSKPFTIEEVRSVMSQAGYGDAVIQPIERPGKRPIQVLIRSRLLTPAVQTKILDGLDKKIGIAARNSIQAVGPGWGAAVTNSAVTALAVSLLGLVTYISLRFEYKMALTAIFAIFHDILLTIGVYALAGREVTPNTVAALLTILGYSLYDTIVVFHRIKENTSHIGKQTFQGMANESINQVLIRSINTTLMTVVPIGSLLAFGGETLRDFAFALFVGLISGAYSSIGVAAPLYAMWKETEPKYAALKRKYGAAAA
jgi:SecD/SecF fusion protein